MADEVYQTIALAAAREEIVLARLAAMDKAVALLEKFPTAIDTAVGNLEKLHQEKFENVGVRFQELNTRLTEGDRYKQTALDAALKAAETLVNKQWENNRESIRKTEELFTKQLESIERTANNLRDTVKENSGGKRASDNSWYVLGIVMSIAIAIGSLLVQILRH